jgi:hypothetical protein
MWLWHRPFNIYIYIFMVKRIKMEGVYNLWNIEKIIIMFISKSKLTISKKIATITVETLIWDCNFAFKKYIYDQSLSFWISNPVIIIIIIIHVIVLINQFEFCIFIKNYLDLWLQVHSLIHNQNNTKRKIYLFSHKH